MVYVSTVGETFSRINNKEEKGASSMSTLRLILLAGNTARYGPPTNTRRLALSPALFALAVLIFVYILRTTTRKSNWRIARLVDFGSMLRKTNCASAPIKTVSRQSREAMAG